MKTQSERLAGLQPVVIAGERWYRAAEVCRIFGISTGTMRRHAPPGSLLVRMEQRSAYRKTKVAYINRAGIEQLAILYARCGRAAAVAALR